jgi:hypothetical protein
MDNNAKRLVDAMEELRTAFAKVNNLTENMTEEVATAFATDYPFEKSFDELDYDVHVWVSNFADNVRGI